MLIKCRNPIRSINRHIEFQIMTTSNLLDPITDQVIIPNSL